MPSQTYRYRGYGMIIDSALELPSLEPAPHTDLPPDFTIRHGHIGVADKTPAQVGAYFRSTLETVEITALGTARFKATRDSILVEAEPGAPEDRVRLFLLGAAIGAALYLREMFLLHGSAVDTPWGAVAFVGTQGAGKSTLAAHLCRRGYAVLCDDVCPVTAAPGEGPALHPAVCHLRLCEDALGPLGEVQNATGEAVFEVDKYSLRFQTRGDSLSRPLAAIHVLSPDSASAPMITEVKGFERYQLLLGNMYRPHYLQGLGTRQKVLHLGHLVASGVKLFRINRQPLDKMDHLLDHLERTWAGQEKGNPKGMAECLK